MKIYCVGAYNYYPQVNAKSRVAFSARPDWFDDEPRNPLSEILFERAYNNFGVSYVGSPSKINDSCTLDDVSHNIMNFRKLANSSYSGESLAHKPEYMKLLKRSGVMKVIDLVNKPELQKLCSKNKLDYYSYDMNWGYGGKSLFNNEKSLMAEQERTIAIRKLKELIDEVNKGHFYMSCEYGEYRTVNCLSLASIFNPEWYGEKIAPATTEFAKKIENMFKNLTDEHKQILGLSEDYCKYLSGYIKKMVKTI